MDFSCERFVPVPDGHLDQMAVEHLSRYSAILPLLAGKRVLDAACGSGYGSRIMAGTAQSVLGIDLSPEAVAMSREGAPDNCLFAQADVTRTGLPTASFDAVVSFETIEHLDGDQQVLFLAEMRRVLAPGGLFIVSTPNRPNYNLPGTAPNPFHVKELDRSEFIALLATRFEVRQVYCQSYMTFMAIWRPGEAQYRLINDLLPSPVDDKYLIAICGGGSALPDLGALFHDPGCSFAQATIAEQDRHRQAEEVSAWARSLQARNEASTRELADETARHLQTREWGLERDAAVGIRDTEISRLQKVLTEMQDWARERDATVMARDARIAEDQAQLARIQAWAQERDAAVAQRDAMTARLQDELARIQAWAQERDGEVASRDAEIIRLQATLSATQAWAQERDRSVAERDASLGRLQADLAGLQRWGQERDAAVRQREGEIGRLQGELTALQAWAQGRDAAVRERDGLLVAGQAERDRLAARIQADAAQLAAQVLQIADLETRIGERDALLAASEEALRRLHAERSMLEARLLTRDGELLGSRAAHAYAQTEIAVLTRSLAHERGEIVRITSGGGYRLLNAYWCLRDTMLPPHSRRRALGKALAAMLRHPWRGSGCLLRGDLGWLANGLDATWPGSQRSAQARRTWKSRLLPLGSRRMMLATVLGGALRSPFDLILRQPWSKFRTAFKLLLRGDFLSIWMRFEQQRGLAELRRAVAEPVPATPLPISAPATVPGAALPQSGRPLVSVVIPAHDHWELTEACLASIAAAPPTVPVEIILADDASSDATREAAARFPGLRVVRSEENLGFLRIVNLAAASARGDYLHLLNNDTRVLPGWLDELVATMEREPEAGAVGSKLVFPDGRLQEAGCAVWRSGAAANRGVFADPRQSEFDHLCEVDYCSAASLLLRRERFNALGGFDERYAPAFYEDADLAFRLRETGLRSLFQPLSMVVHLGGASCGAVPGQGLKDCQERNRGVFAERWKGTLTRHREGGDPLDTSGRCLAARRILVLDEHPPAADRDAGSVVLCNLMQVLRGLGWSVCFCPLEPAAADDPRVRVLRGSGIEVACPPWYPTWQSLLHRRGKTFDAVLMVRHRVGMTVLGDVTCFAGQASRLFLPADLHWLRSAREAERTGDQDAAKRSQREKRDELALMEACAATILHSSHERSLVLGELPKVQACLLPWIEAAQEAVPGPAERADAVFVGGFAHAPNADAVLHLARAIWPLVRARLPRARLLIVGADPPPPIQALAGEGIEVLGQVPDLAGLLAQVRVSLAPLRWGAGFKGKVASSLCQGVPVVASPVAAEGMGLADGCGLLLAQDDQVFAEAAISLLQDDARWNAVSAAGLAHARAQWSRRRAEDTLVRLFSVLGTKPAGLTSDRIETQARLAGAPNRAFDVLVFPVINWHFRFQRPQQLAAELGRLGHRVFYLTIEFLDPAEGRDFLFRECPGENLFIVSIACPLPHPTVYKQIPDAKQIAALRAALHHLRDACGIESLVALIDIPFWREVVTGLQGCLSVYDCMDYHPGFLDNAKEVLDEEDRLIREADMVVTTSEGLRQVVGRVRDSALVRNACDVEHFARIPAEVVRFSEGPVIGYFGAISHWYDMELLAACARARPQWTFVLIGSTHGCDISAAERLGNVRFTGEVPYGELPRFVHGFDVCVIPFQIIELIVYTNPVKMYEYLAAGKPMVATAMPEVVLVAEEQPGLVHVGRDRPEFLAALDRAMGEVGDRALAERRRTWARQQTWTNRGHDLARAVQGLTPRVSVIVLCYNNLDLTKRCLDSIERCSGWPELELVVVDNASQDGTAAWLRGWAEGRPWVKLVLNERNLGFAAGNNRGLAVATGEYLVLLNNDTHVTRGWIAGLVRHFRRDPRLGLLGPVSNNIGNEARIDISYESMEEMQVRSRRFTEANAGRIREIRAPAFFCAMFRREVYAQVGDLDEVFGLGMFEDDDYCNRIRQAGWSVALTDDVFIHHELSASFSQVAAERRQANFEKNRAIYEAKWGTWEPHRYRDPIPKA